MTIPFRDRRSAGVDLADRLPEMRWTDAMVLGIPKGGVPVAFEVARRLGGSLDVLLHRRLAGPAPDAAALGYIGSGGARILDRDLIYQARVPPALVDEITRAARIGLLGEESEYREEMPPLNVRGRPVILVDDGSARLDSLRRSLLLVRELDATRVVLAVPTLPRAWSTALAHLADEVVCVISPQVHEPRRWYVDFTTPTRGEIRALLALALVRRTPPSV